MHFIRVVQAVFHSITAQLFGDTEAIGAAPVRIQTAVRALAVVFVRASRTLHLSITAGRCVDTTYGTHAGELASWALRKTCRRHEKQEKDELLRWIFLLV